MTPTALPRQSLRFAAARRILLLGLTLLAYLRGVFLLDLKPLWWDESLSVQRVEQPLGDLLRGVLWISDGMTSVLTIDQHPFFYFLVQGVVMAGAGIEEFAVRYTAALAATLFVPALWVLARWFVRRQLAPPATPWFAVLLAATSPFLLWFGQEARPYALWATLTTLSVYLLLRATETPQLQRPAAVGFVIVALMTLATHYFAVFLLPFQALVIGVWAWRSRRVWAVVALLALLGAGALVALYAAWLLIGQGGGGNFAEITLPILIPDLVNAFSLGLSVDYGAVWWIDLIFGALALLGLAWGLLDRRRLAAGGWLLPAFFVIALALLLAINAYRPLYMTARHLSQLLSGFLLAVAIGLGAIWTRQRIVAAALTLGLLAAVGYSTLNYFTDERYAKDDYRRLGEYMAVRMMPGDLILYDEPATKRIFEYYAPLDRIYAAIDDGATMAVFGAPLLDRSVDDTIRWLEEQAPRYQRIWLLRSGNHITIDPEGEMESWMDEHFILMRDVTFFSQSSLHAKLYLPTIPVFEDAPPPIAQPVLAQFGEQIRLVGYAADPPQAADLPSQTRLYWEVTAKPDRRYRYIWRRLVQDADGAIHELGAIEREPYEGDAATLYWDPDRIIMEFIEMPPLRAAPVPGQHFYALELYDAETLEKLPVTAIEGGEIAADGVTALFPVATP
jgi:hypothetical protein